MPIGSIVGGLISQGGSQAAGAAYGQAGKNADFIRRQNQALESPWFQSGMKSQDLVSQLLGLGHYTDDGQGYGGVRIDDSNTAADQGNALARFKTSPDYNFRLTQGVNALDRSAASKGMLLSGAQTKGVQQYGGDLASGEYQNWLKNLMGVGGQGQAAAGTEVGSNLSTLDQQNKALGGQASAYQSGANALAGGIMSGVRSAASLFGAAGGFGSSFGGGGVTAGAAPTGGYGGYAGYANSLPGFNALSGY